MPGLGFSPEQKPAAAGRPAAPLTFFPLDKANKLGYLHRMWRWHGNARGGTCGRETSAWAPMSQVDKLYRWHVGYMPVSGQNSLS